MQALNSGLSLVLGPVPEVEFFRDYWEQIPLHVSRSDAEQFSSLLSLEMIETLLSSQALYFPSVQLVQRNEPVLVTEYTDETRRIIPQRLIEHHRQGATIVLSQAHDRVPCLADFRRSMQAALQLRCQTNVYLSSPGKQGFNAHFDSHDVFILQVAGSKTFNFYGGGTELPYSHDDFDAARHPCGDLQQSIPLKAGDTLYIPRGVMHDAVASGGTSLHITLGVYAVTMRDAVMEMMQQLTEREASYRHSVPRHWLQPGSVSQTLMAESVLNDVTPVFTEQRLSQALSTLADGAAIDSAADCHGMLMPGASDPILTLNSSIRLRRSLLISVERSDSAVRCRTHGQVLEFHDPLRQAVEQLLGDESRTVRELQGLDDEQKLAMCDRLRQASLLEVIEGSQDAGSCGNQDTRPATDNY